MISNVKGIFTDYGANIYFAGEDFMTPEIDFFMNPASINTGDDKRDAHLKSVDFFDVENHKQITFSSKSCEKTGNDGHFTLHGNLMMRGITQHITLDVEFGGIMKDPWGNQKAGFTLNGKINRKDWGLSWNAALEAGGVLVSDEVRISCEVELVKQS